MPRKPESVAPPDIYYNEDRSYQYTKNSRISKIQLKMADRCLELLQLSSDNTKHILDIGCGSGLSGESISQLGHSWIGVDISTSMLKICSQRHKNPQSIQLDIGQGLPFTDSVFDGVISVSVLQWLCEASTSKQNPFKRMKIFFDSLYRCLKPNSWAACQFYPEGQKQIDLLTNIAKSSGFTGGLVVDFPESKKAKKYYLCLKTSGGNNSEIKVESNTSEIASKNEGDNFNVSFVEKTKSRKLKKKKIGKVRRKSFSSKRANRLKRKMNK